MEILKILRMSMLEFSINCVLVLTLIGCGIAALNMKRKGTKPPKSNKRHRIETKSELSRRRQEEDKLTAIMNEANSDELYTD